MSNKAIFTIIAVCGVVVLIIPILFSLLFGSLVATDTNLDTSKCQRLMDKVELQQVKKEVRSMSATANIKSVLLPGEVSVKSNDPWSQSLICLFEQSFTIYVVENGELLASFRGNSWLNYDEENPAAINLHESAIESFNHVEYLNFDGIELVHQNSQGYAAASLPLIRINSSDWKKINFESEAAIQQSLRKTTSSGWVIVDLKRIEDKKIDMTLDNTLKFVDKDRRIHHTIELNGTQWEIQKQN